MSADNTNPSNDLSNGTVVRSSVNAATAIGTPGANTAPDLPEIPDGVDHNTMARERDGGTSRANRIGTREVTCCCSIYVESCN
jgi:hypothetical protein